MQNDNLSERQSRLEAFNSFTLDEESKSKHKHPFLYELYYKQLWEKAKDIYGWAVALNTSKKVTFGRLKKLIRQLEKDELISKIMENLSKGDDLLFNVFMPKEKYDILIHHSVNVTILSLKLGMAIKQYSEAELRQLGFAALVHDIGMGGVPVSIINKETDLSGEEKKAIERHPYIGRSYLSELGEEYNWLATICYQEHERENGQGYPEGLFEDQINLMAKIIGLADTVDAMVHPRPWKKTQSPPDAIESILGTQKDFFSPNLVKTLLREISPFPPGSYIQLNSKEIGQVIGIAKKYPLRPDILIYFDSNRIQLKRPKIIKLSTNPFLQIRGSFNFEEFDSMNSTLMSN
jgi:HD-GYP domain-containing protein (c-di-GMP phosphodiesterase class II)